MAQARSKTVPEKVLEFVDMSAAMAEKAASVLSRQEEMEKQAADLIPTAVDELLKAKLIEPEEKQAAKKAKHHAKQKEMAGIEKTGNPQPDGKDISAAAAATKSDAKTTTEQRKASASQQTKPTTGQ